MTTAFNFELTSTKKESGRNPTTQRRQTLLNALGKQIIIARFLIDNGEMPTNHTNGKKLTPWFWLDEKGRYLLSINYGKKPLELAKGKFSIVCNDLVNVIESIKLVKDAVLTGELDNIIALQSKKIRSNFKK